MLAFFKQMAFAPDNPFGMFHGLTAYPLLTALGQAFCGLMVAMILKYFDILIKSICSAVAMLTTYASSVLFVHKPITMNFTVAVCIIGVAVYIYNVMGQMLKKLTPPPLENETATTQDDKEVDVPLVNPPTNPPPYPPAAV